MALPSVGVASRVSGFDRPVLAQERTAYHTLQQGIEQYNAEQFTEAIQLWRQAAVGFDQQGQPLQQAFVWSNLSLAYQQLALWPDAEAAIARSFELLQTPETPETPSPESAAVTAKAWNAQGYLYWHQGQLEPALAAWRQATTRYHQAEDRSGVILTHLNQARVLQALGLNRQAIATLETTHHLLQTAPVAVQALGRLHLGDALRRIGALEDSAQILNAAVELAPDAQIRGQAQLALANTDRAFSHREIAIGEDAAAQNHAAAPCSATQP
ncbi:MAG: hypothetical protein HC812_03100 [Leptolyngbya sp. RL_3_1]|nr:hypothetical protein [Leptolyngbya sp. RL_3_1]